MKTISLAFIWLVGLRDYSLTRWLIDVEGPQAELNLVARYVAVNYGSSALLPYKLAMLMVFTVVVLALYRTDRRTGQCVNHVGLIAHALLGAWWNVVLFASPTIGVEEMVL